MQPRDIPAFSLYDASFSQFLIKLDIMSSIDPGLCRLLVSAVKNADEGRHYCSCELRKPQQPLQRRKWQSFDV